MGHDIEFFPIEKGGPIQYYDSLGIPHQNVEPLHHTLAALVVPDELGETRFEIEDDPRGVVYGCLTATGLAALVIHFMLYHESHNAARCARLLNGLLNGGGSVRGDPYDYPKEGLDHWDMNLETEPILWFSFT
jgi:hypothetical protein